MVSVVTDNLGLWTSALLTKSTVGRSGNGKQEAYGIKKLRELVLELAVRGGLVPQDPNEEPANVILERVAAARDRSIREGRIKRQKELPKPSDDNKPFCLPKGWQWVSLSQLGMFSGGKTPSKMKAMYWDGDIPWVTPKDMKIPHIYDTEDHVTKAAIDDGLELYEPESVLFVVRSGILRRSFPVAVAKVKCTVNQDLKVLSLFKKELSPYVHLMMRGFERYILENLTKTGMTVESVLFDEFSTHYFMLPPLAEQHRIIAKVDELMTLCDQLEQQQTQSVEAHQTVVEILLGTLTGVESQQELTDAWNRIANHFDTLFTTDYSINQLNKTILQLAVMGRLVSQDHNDEPANELLKRIQVEKARLTAEGRIKQDTPSPEIADDEKPYVLPQGWEYARLADLTSVLNGRAYAKDELLDVGTPVLRVGNLFTSRDWYYSDLELDEDKYCDAGDLLFAWSASFGPFIWPGPKVIYHYHIWKLKLHSEANLNKRFLYKFLLEKTEEMKASGHGVSMIHMTKQAMEKIVVPVPPLAEQSRIVARVDELLVLCDALKARLNEAQTTQIHLADAIVEQAVDLVAEEAVEILRIGGAAECAAKN